MSSSKCPNPQCENSTIEVDPVRGDVICTSCGQVLSENYIVSDVQFLENSKGGSSAVGQFVSYDASSNRPKLLRSFHGMYSRESKEITLGNAKRRIKELGQQLSLTSNLVDIAFNFFKMALDKGLTKGRKNCLIIGACVYITCRTDENNCILLIDVSDALRIDVYELGRTYLRLSNALCITIPFMDPCLYILRFARKLQFGDNTQQVYQTALKLVKRMKKDWIHIGRRPSGLCGAALILAARLHNFNRTILDVISVVKVHESTLRKRLTEFGETPSSGLTPQEFLATDLAEEQDPPAYIAARKKEQERIELMIDKNKDLDSEFNELQKEIENHIKERRRNLKGIWAKYDEKEDKELRNANKGKEDFVLNSGSLFSEQQIATDKEATDAEKFITESTLTSINECLNDTRDSVSNSNKLSSGIGPSAASLGLKDSIEDCMKVIPSDPEPLESGILDLTGIDDDEINSYIMSEREIKLKTELWMEINKEYLEEMKLKEERELKEAEEREKSGKPAKKRKTYTKRNKNAGPANTAGEAIEKMLQDKKLSNKINYDVLRNINGEDEEILEPLVEYNTPLNNKPPVETPVEIQSILNSLAGKKMNDAHEEDDENELEAKRLKFDDKVEDVDGGKDDDEEEDDEEDEYEDEDEFDTGTALSLRRGEEMYDVDDYDDYD